MTSQPHQRVTGTATITPPRGVTRENNGPVQGNGPRDGGSHRMNNLLAALDDVQIGTDAELAQFCEALRKLTHVLAVSTHLAAAELHANAQAQAKADATLGVPGFSIRRAMAKVNRKLVEAADHLGSASSASVSAWTTFEKEFAPALDKSRSKPNTSARKFTVGS